jgi:hypothetical protein
MSNYQGHLNDGSSIQKHSVGSLYPAILYVQHDKYGVITPDDQMGTLVGTYDEALKVATQWKENK